MTPKDYLPKADQERIDVLEYTHEQRDLTPDETREVVALTLKAAKIANVKLPPDIVAALAAVTILQDI